jgi:hypothetical protein
LCRISTGTGYAKRKLYTDRDTTRFRVVRPQVITAIVDVVAAPDLLDRSLLAQQPERDGDPAPEEELLTVAAELTPRVLGQLLDAAAVALRCQKKVKLHTTPRMVGPTRWVEAAAEVLGLKPGAFLDAYLDSQERAGEMALEASLIGAPLVDMLAGRDALARLAEKEGRWYESPGFRGTAKDLLGQLDEYIRGRPHPSRGWPRTPRGLSGALRRIAPALRRLGYTVEFAREGDAAGTRTITIDTAYSREIAARSAHNENHRRNRQNRQKPGGMGSRSDGFDGSDGRMRTQTTMEHK